MEELTPGGAIADRRRKPAAGPAEGGRSRSGGAARLEDDPRRVLQMQTGKRALFHTGTSGIQHLGTSGNNGFSYLEWSACSSWTSGPEQSRSPSLWRPAGNVWVWENPAAAAARPGWTRSPGSSSSWSWSGSGGSGRPDPAEERWKDGSRVGLTDLK